MKKARLGKLRVTSVLLLLALLGAAPAHLRFQKANGTFSGPDLPLLPGSLLPIDVTGLRPPYDLALLGPGHINRSTYFAPDEMPPGAATLVASGATASAMRTISFVAPPQHSEPFLVVASYDDGLIFHHLASGFAPFGALTIAGAPSDVAISPSGSIAAGATNNLNVSIVRRMPWNVAHVGQVPLTDEIAFDAKSEAVFLTNRDLGIGGAGAVTRITSAGAVTRTSLGATAEGIAVDSVRRRVYVANTNDGTISIVDADTVKELVRFHAVARVFSLALSPDGKYLYATSNQSTSSPFGAPGSAVKFDVTAKPRLIARSRRLAFPLGIAASADGRTLFVTDEHDDSIDVLDAKTLRESHAPLATCKTPWKPLVDAGRLYVPCARADLIDVFDTTKLARIAGAPFRTGGYPLAVAVWHGNATSDARAGASIPRGAHAACVGANHCPRH